MFFSFENMAHLYAEEFEYDLKEIYAYDFVLIIGEYFCREWIAITLSVINKLNPTKYKELDMCKKCVAFSQLFLF